MLTKRKDRVYVARKLDLLEKNPKFLRMKKELSKPPTMFRRKGIKLL